MIKVSQLHPQYITDEKGEKKSIILPILEFNKLLEDFDDLTAIAERKDEPTISHKELIKELENESLI